MHSNYRPDTETAPAMEHMVQSLELWLQFPLVLSEIPEDLSPWRPATPPLGDFEQHTYFHSFVADQIFGSPTWRSGTATGNGPSFDTFIRKDVTGDWEADKLVERDAESGGKEFAVKRFQVEVECAELRVMKRPEGRGLAVVTVHLEVTGASQCDWQSKAGALQCGDFPEKPFTLADGQDALDWIRRVYPRWWIASDPRPIPGDALVRMRRPGAGPDEWPDQQTMEASFAETGHVPLLPWIRKLIDPLDADGDTDHRNACHLNDERAYMASVVSLSPLQRGDHVLSDQETMLAISQGDLFRIAEADRSGDSANFYSPEFNEKLRKAIFYDRHAPHRDADPWRTTYYLFTHHHMSAVTTFGQIRRDMARFYRHMHMLCVFEYYQLIVFSRELSALVRDFEAGLSGDQDFRRRLQAIRREFLHHTHLHHFSNVSSQLQPREMFARLYEAFGIAAMYREVDDELRSASEFADSRRAEEEAKRSMDLNAYVATGVPAALALSATGIGFLFGENALDAPILKAVMEKQYSGAAPVPLLRQVGQLAFLLALSYGAWALAAAWFIRPGDDGGRPPCAGPRRDGASPSYRPGRIEGRLAVYAAIATALAYGLHIAIGV